MSKPAIGLMGYDVLDNSACKGLCLIGVSVVGYNYLVFFHINILHFSVLFVLPALAPQNPN
jgi:hypothetical protein